MRTSGFDFYPDGKRRRCLHPGWETSGSSKVSINSKALSPGNAFARGSSSHLVSRSSNDTIHVTCRDQLARLHDLNGDEDDRHTWSAFNNDHQVTEHFHEFAMGLQTDDKGNFYYAKSARHALKDAVVPPPRHAP